MVAASVERDGVRVPGFADIFKNNCSKNAVLTIELSAPEVEKIFQAVERHSGLEATADAEAQRLTLHTPKEIAFHFDIDPAVRERLTHGLDDIGLTLKREDDLRLFETKHDVQL